MHAFPRQGILSQSTPLLVAVLLLLGLSLSVQAQPGASSLGGLGNNQRPTPLPLAEAFPYFVSEAGDGKYRVTWTPASGHYLYQHAFDFSLETAAGDQATPVRFDLPEGLPRTDQFFGDIVAYYDDVSVNLQLTDEPSSGDVLIIEYQGCADWGFCYPPQRQRFELRP